MTAYRTRTHLVEGDQAQVSAALARAGSRGDLVSLGELESLPEGRVRVTAELREPRSWDDRLRPWLRVTSWMLAIAAAGGLGWLLGWAVLALIGLVTTAVAWVHAHLAGIAVTAVVIVLLLALCSASASDGCSGLHCGGCRR